MGFSCGIVGLPNAGKSTIFNALTGASAQVGPYPFTTVDPNVGVIFLPDDRLDFIASLCGSRTKTYSSIRVVDIAGLVKGASRGEGLGNRFLGHIREVDAVIHVVRCFGDDSVSCSDSGPAVSPERDVSIVMTELCLADLEVVDRRAEAVAKLAQSGDSRARKIAGDLAEIRRPLNRGLPLRLAGLDRAHGAVPGLITSKPWVYVANVAEPGADAEGSASEEIRAIADREGAPFVEVCGKVEAELAELDPEESRLFARELGYGESRILRIARAGHDALGLVTFFTANENEAKAWTVPADCPAAEAAGKVHSDMKKGFIRAETISHEDLRKAGSISRAKEMGLLRSEGRDYRILDGDLVFFRFQA